MRVVQVVPGTGGTFYCQNCMRDSALVRSLRRQGLDVIMVPMYLPLTQDGTGLSGDVPVFFGGVNAYLQQQFKLFRATPRWVDRLFDSPWMLRQAAAREGSTSAAALGPMTLSMLQGRDGNQRKEVARLTTWLAEQEQPDVVHFSNALLLGVADDVKQALGVPIVCSLQDEHTWVDAIVEPYQTQCWEVMAEKARSVDAFIAVSDWYADQMSGRMAIPRGSITVAPAGIKVDGIEPRAEPVDPPAIGYLSRMCECLGLGLLVDAFLKLRENPGLQGLRLRLTGGHTVEDKDFLARLHAQLDQHGATGHVDILDDFQGQARHEFLRSLSVLSVPMPAGEAFGSFIIEALAFGVPVVQPAVGAFPEIIEATGGGIVYDPTDAGGLARALESLLLDRDRARELGTRGRAAVLKDFDVERTSEQVLAVYNGVVET